MRHSLVVFAALACFGCSSEQDPIVIGLAGPFGQPRGESMRLAAELARDEINAAGGIGGRLIELMVRDDSGSGDVAIRVAQDLYDTPEVVAVIGHLTSGATLAAAPIYNGGDHPVVEISPSASSPLITQAGPWTFRVCPAEHTHGARLADWAWNTMGVRNVAILYENTDYGRGVRGAFTENFLRLGGRIITQDPYLMGEPEVNPYLVHIMALPDVDAVMIAGSRAEGEMILARMSSLGMRLPLLAGDGMVGLERSAALQASLNISMMYLADQAGDKNQRFVAAYREANGDRLPDHRGASTYDIVHLLARAIEGSGPDRALVREYLDRVGTDHPAYEGVTGTIAFDENGDVPGKTVVVGTASSGALVSATRQN
jgi:branched-chain amino acid transport system substrate-binding protein